jgi:predicted DNA-binding WGR domain protein
MINFEDFLSEGKKLQIKRKYTENHPAQTVGKTANVRNAVLQAIKDGVVTREEFNKILSELSTSSSQWASRNRKYFNVSEEGVKLSKWGRRILAELDETPKAAEVFEATVEMDALDPDNKDFLKFLKKNRVKIINKVMDGPGGGTPVITMQGKRKDLEKVLADPELGWDDPELGEYIEESVVNEKIKVTKSDWPNAVVKYKGKKYEIEFDDYDVIDDHGNEGKDLYFMGVDQEGGNWEVDVYADYRDEVEDIHWDTLIYKGIDESVVNEAKFVKDFDKAVLDAETEKDVLKVYPKAEFYVGKMSHFFGELEPNLFFKAYYAKYYKQDTGKSIKGDFKITTVYSEKGSRYVNLHVEESAITENYEVIYSDGVSAMKKFRNEKQALDFMKKTIASNKKLRDIAVYKPGMHSTTQTELVVKFWGDGSYLDNVSKRDKNLAAKKLEENTNMKSEINLFESFSDFVGANFLNEAIKSSILRTVLSNGREGKEAKKNLSNLAKGFYNLSKVALDKIEDEDFIISNDVSKIFKNYGGSSHVLFFISDNEKENPYYDHNNGSWNDYKMVPGGGIVLAAMSGDRQFYANEWSRWAGARSWSKQKKGDVDQIGINHKYRGWGASGLNNGKRIAEMSDRVIVINLELIRQKYSTQQLRDARKAAKADATAFKSDKDFRDANRNRYHKILADKAASLPLDKMVSDAIDKLAKQISDGLKKGEKTRYQEIKIGESPKGKEVKAKDASQHMSNILDDYSRYVDYIRQAEESEARYGEKESYYERESKNYAKQIKERINKIDSFDYAW